MHRTFCTTSNSQLPSSSAPAMIRFLLMILLWMIPLTYSQQKQHLRRLQEEPAKNPRIIGGQDAIRNRFPAMVLLGDREMKLNCGGTLISPTVVLTAAHCRSGLLYYALIGRYDTTDSREEYEAIPIKQALVHPQNDESTFAYDIMLLILERAPTRAVEYMRISKTPPMLTVGQALVSVGWGVTSPDSDMVWQVLQQVTLQYVTNGQCELAKSIGDSYKDVITEDMLCTLAPNKDHCYGDSGGPLLLLGADPAEDVQVGIVSWGYECASPVFPGVAARTSYGYEWIRQQVCIFDGDSSDYECDPALTEEPSSAPSNETEIPERWSLSEEPSSAPTKAPTLECGSVQALCTYMTDCCSGRCVLRKCQQKITSTRQKLAGTARGGAAGRREAP